MRGVTYGDMNRTDTYLTTFSQQGEYQIKDKSLHKAIKQNDASIILPKEIQAHTESAVLFDEQKQLSGAIIDLRKRFDMTKIQSNQTEKNILRMEEEKLRLAATHEQMMKKIDETKAGYQAMLELIKDGEQMIEYGDYQHAVRLNMKDVLKHDILHVKKLCFDENVKLIRTNTGLKELQQRNTNRKHVKSKCKLVLNSLQQTVQTRQTQRQAHLNEVEQILRKKLDNNDMKQSREQFLEDALYRALTDRMPEEKYLLGKWKCETVLKELLRTKMRKTIEKYHEVETSFSTIKKSTNIKTTNEFINEFLQKEQKYGDLLGTIQKAQAKIKLEKQTKEVLEKQYQNHEYKTYELEKMMKPEHNKDDHDLNKNLNKYNEKILECKKLEISLRKWATSTWVRLQTIGKKQQLGDSHQDVLKQLQGVSLKKIININLNSLLLILNEKQKEQKKEQIKKALTPEKKSQMTTQRTGNGITLRELTDESTLSKEYSRRNFRVKTVAAVHEDTLEQKDHQYDEIAEYNFLRHNRKVAKKNNKVVVRPRLKTKAH